MEIKELEIINNEILLDFIERVRDKHQELFKDVTLMSQITKFSEEYNEMEEATKHIDENPEAFYEELADMFIAIADGKAGEEDLLNWIRNHIH